MECVWYPTGLEAGIDGYIEIRDPKTGEVSNCIVQVQSKATLGQLGPEGSDTFTYLCEEADLKYWLSGTAPVILVRSNPVTGEAYWASIKDRFATPEARNSRRIIFHKSRDRFDKDARDAIVQLAVPADSGLYLSPIPRTEILETNLLHVLDFPATYFTARALVSSRQAALALLLENNKSVPSAWIVKGKTVFSLHDLSNSIWDPIRDRGSIEELPLEDWAFDEDPEQTRDFVQLLNLALTETLRASFVGFDQRKHHYYFWASRDLTEKRISFRARTKNSSRTVFKGYKAKADPERVSYYRHSAMHAMFHRIGARWYLEINPTYRFTRDGKNLHRFHEDLLTTITRFDGALAFANQVVMWADYLARHDLFSKDNRLLGFGKLATVTVPMGIDDRSWLQTEEDSARITSSSDDRQLLLEIL